VLVGQLAEYGVPIVLKYPLNVDKSGTPWAIEKLV
jgi:hypothetical protein